MCGIFSVRGHWCGVLLHGGVSVCRGVGELRCAGVAVCENHEFIYPLVCPSIGPSVCLSVCPLVCCHNVKSTKSIAELSEINEKSKVKLNGN